VCVDSFVEGDPVVWLVLVVRIGFWCCVGFEDRFFFVCRFFHLC